MSDTWPIHLSIIVPAYNEVERILPTLETLESFAERQSYSVEIIVVDDGSTDGTYDVILRHIAQKEHFKLIRHPVNVGKGEAVKKGMLIANGAYRLFSDADLSTPIEEIHKLLSFLEPASSTPHDVAIGSRRLKGAALTKRQPFYREGSGRIFSVLVRLLVLRGFLDTQCGFKVFSARAALDIFSRLTIPGFGFDVEALYIAQKVCGYKIIEVPITWSDSAKSHVNLLRDSLPMFFDLFKIRFRHH